MKLLDTTLRDGLQAAGVFMETADKVTLARVLLAAGVPLLEVGVPASGDFACTEISIIAGNVGPEHVLVWCRARAGDIEAAANKTAAAHVHISFPVSTILLDTWRRDRAWVLRELDALVTATRAGNRFLTVSVGAQDASRADAAFLREFAAGAKQLGADRLRLADTTGIWLPEAAARTVTDLREIAPPLEIHAHNDLGLATAVTLAAVGAGAEWANVTVDGIGERAGNAALAEVVTAWQLAAHGEITPAFDSTLLVPLSRTLDMRLERPIAGDKPIVGYDVVKHTSGIHCAGVLRNPAAYEPFAPESVGHEIAAGERFEIGANIGSALIAHLLKISVEAARELVPVVQARVRKLRRPLTIGELKRTKGRAPAQL